jgi:hypothetical protein
MIEGIGVDARAQKIRMASVASVPSKANEKPFGSVPARPLTMKIITPLALLGALASTALLTIGTANAAFIIETSGTLGSGNYAYTGPGGTAASTSTASSGNLAAFTDVPQTFFTLAHVYGGNSPTLDQYTFTYSPATDGDNVAFTAGDLYNSRGALPDLAATGLAAVSTGTYNVFRIHPANPGTTLGNTTTYNVQVNGGLTLTETIDQNPANFATGENVGRWELIGSVDLLNPTDTVSVTMTPNGNPIGFVSMRASGIMFEYVGPVPEPSSAALLALGSMIFLGRRRR